MYLQSHTIIFFLDQLKKQNVLLHHVRLNVLKFFFEVQITFNIWWQVSNIKTPRNFLNVNRFPEKKEYNSLPSSKLECHLSIWKIQEQIQNETLIPSETHKKRKLFIWSKTQISPSWNYLGMSQDTKFPGASFSVIGASCGNIKLLVNNKNIT